MPIDVDKKKWRKAMDWRKEMSKIPINPVEYRVEGWKSDYDGEWISWETWVTGMFPAIGIRMQYQDVQLDTCIRCKVPDPFNTYFFFYETGKGQYDTYQGFHTSSTTYYAQSNTAGGQTSTAISGQNWSVETELRLKHHKDQTKCEFWVNGELKVTHTTNISAQPYQICCLEPKGVIKVLYLRYPAGIYVAPSS